MLHQNSSEESILLRRSNVQNGKGLRIVATQEMLLDWLWLIAVNNFSMCGLEFLNVNNVRLQNGVWSYNNR